LLRPPAYRLVQGETIEAFFAEARTLRERVDQAAEE
jgi:hypothetical protein